MQGRLKKIGNEYKLYAQDDSCIATSWYSPYQRLSKNNCQAIENGYDLDELAKEASDGLIENHIWAISMTFFKAGFQKALELLGDKKFSEEDILKAIAFGWDYEGRSKEEMLKIHNVNLDYNDSYVEDTQKYIQSLQQTEWDVSFNPDEKDSEGCLILKRL